MTNKNEQKRVERTNRADKMLNQLERYNIIFSTLGNKSKLSKNNLKYLETTLENTPDYFLILDAVNWGSKTEKEKKDIMNQYYQSKRLAEKILFK